MEVQGIEIGKCPKCNHPVGNEQRLPWCNKRTEKLPDESLSLSQYLLENKQEERTDTLNARTTHESVKPAKQRHW
jgi:endogenous inhibitor of DNA gyrase (YacG/DUF329 family)